MVDDIELLGQYAAEKSEASFAALVERHIDFVYEAARRRLGGDAHGAADVTQQVFVRLARQAPALARGVVLPAWLYAATRNVAIDLVRAEQRRRTHEKEAQMHEELSMNAASPAEWERLRPMLDGVIDELADSDRQAVLLRFFARRPFAEIGRTLRISEDAARMCVDRALEKLHALLARRGVTSTTAALGLLMTNEAAAAAPAGLAASVLGPALAGANAAPVAAWISFMNITKSVAVAAGVMLSLTVGVGIQQGHAYRDAQTALTGETRATEMLNARLQQERERADTAERDRADLERVVAAARGEAQRAAGRTVLGAPPGQSPTAVQMIANGHDFLRANPEARRLLVEYTRARTDGAWGPLLKSLRLTQEQIGAFHAAHEAAAGLYFGQTTGDVSMSMFLTEEGRISQTELNARVRAVLGEDGYRQWQEFNRVSPATSATANLAGDLYWSDSPLSRAQAERLTAILVDNSPDYAAGQNINLNKVNWPAALAQAGAVLDDTQLATLVAEREQSDYLKALNRAQQDARDRWQAARDAKAKD